MNSIARFTLCCAALLGMLGLMPAAVAALPMWSAPHTRLVVISLAGFSGEAPGKTSFSTSDRLDDPLVAQFLELGVPQDQVLYLKDAQATKEAITAKFPDFLAESDESERLIFYYSSHGGYDPKTGAHTFSTFNGSMPIGWFFGKIESKFHGKQALLFSDCCYSGGLVNLAKAGKDNRISYGALSTTGSCNLGFSGWRFTDLLIRAWAGDVAMDYDKSGSVDFTELCVFAEGYMAFVAEGKPLFATTGLFDYDLVLSETSRPAKKGIGARVEVLDNGAWYKAEVVDVKTDETNAITRMRVHYTDKSRYAKVQWVNKADTRKYQYPSYKIGTHVEIKTSNGVWLPGKVLASFQNMHECSYDGKTSFYNEWMSPSRIRLP